MKVQKEEKDKERNSEGTDQWEHVRPSPWSRNNQTTEAWGGVHASLAPPTQPFTRGEVSTPDSLRGLGRG